MCLYCRFTVAQTWLLVLSSSVSLVVAGLVCFLTRPTIPTLSQLVTSSQHFVNNTHRVMGTHCTDVIFTHQEFDSPQARCRTVRDSPLFSSTCSRLATTLPRLEFHTSISPEADNSQHGAVRPEGPRRFHVVLFARE